ncbi:hypothetical protein OPV22_008609 [Ensete ventricosum]|uniref:Expansin n=1 Tax=Ensete ventricosum TaxID=4639 RepID=A0AAV8RCM6_ENSVE|nr:hypothetical protein OPV22_008609 [Ensete ventricosum]
MRIQSAAMASSSSSSLPWSLALLVLLAMAMRRAQGGFVATKWSLAHATFYGDDSASSTMGGACGYGDLYGTGYGTNTAALSSVLFSDGYGCGQCYDIRCSGAPACYAGSPIVTVTATNLCPPNWAQPSDNGGWCNPPRVHFDMAKPAFNQIADWHAGIVPVMYRRVACAKTGGIRFQLQGNAYWLLVFVTNVGGGGDIAGMWVKGATTEWISMSHNWGASYQAFSCLGGQELSFKVLSYTSQETLVAYAAAPANWVAGLTYEATTNFN